MISKRLITAGITLTVLFSACKTQELKMSTAKEETAAEKKVVVYQVFTRLFGNKNKTNKPWGTIEENGVGKFNDFTDKVLHEIKDLGVTYIWYTGVPHHALVRDYTAYGISNDDPEVVKGRAGSPYAVKDYYNVNPDLAENPAKRLEEFEALVKRTHNAGLKVIIDIVPNHIARKYEGKSNPAGVKDFGADDDVNVEYKRDNNFYYIPKEHFEIPDGDIPLNGEKHPLIDGKFDENPAKWTGNGSRKIKPDQNDWYETVKVNYGVRPDGTKDFPELPAGFDQKSYKEHFAFWQDKDVPDSWKKFRDIALYWTAKGVDGFRYDMAEMVPYEFWSYMNSSIKMKNPNAFLLAEVYNPNEYRNYIRLGKMDYLYDKVETYDKLKDVIRGKSSPDELTEIQNRMSDIEHHMLHFLDNHDEQRLASPDFAGTPERGKPLMVVSATISTSPTMIYFGQEVGEAGNEDAGFGKPSRTSIFDYIGVPNHQRWMNDGKFDGGQLSDSEKKLRDFYKRLLNFTINSSALMGSFEEIQFANRQNNEGYDALLYSYVRWSEKQKLVVITNFSSEKESEFDLKIPSTVISKWHLKDGSYVLVDKLYSESKTYLTVKNGEGSARVKIKPSESFIYEVN
ncbi:alpha-amylase family protein [Flavobacterium sp. S87F.05.LMB.W.Kidney.N]|uniref:alpha-amylase family protein n=1 Tax=Flavobacterium sp. S87F.05.LMB.W.Kidney.N TaxID=1278758 RepID=UPI001066971F|nr:alpha-amylase family protein [Flavobacterium sp. S87F.05.LMB.W.Kidney.N]TDX11736.1 glycosidase [Flavobacterium sp. S87F.05.LMB.W.Kidney.N]